MFCRSKPESRFSYISRDFIKRLDRIKIRVPLQTNLGFSIALLFSCMQAKCVALRTFYIRIICQFEFCRGIGFYSFHLRISSSLFPSKPSCAKSCIVKSRRTATPKFTKTRKVITAVKVQIEYSLVMTSCSLVDGNRNCSSPFVQFMRRRYPPFLSHGPHSPHISHPC